MKIYVLLEGHYDRMIRGVTLCPSLAQKICRAFSHLSLFVEEYETIDNETLKNFLEIRKTSE